MTRDAILLILPSPPLSGERIKERGRSKRMVSARRSELGRDS